MYSLKEEVGAVEGGFVKFVIWKLIGVLEVTVEPVSVTVPSI